jgi:hypothetical protein
MLTILDSECLVVEPNKYNICDYEHERFGRLIRCYLHARPLFLS